MLASKRTLGMYLLIALAEIRGYMTQILGSTFDSGGRTVGKGENTGYQNFLLFPQCFQKASSPRLRKLRFMW